MFQRIGGRPSQSPSFPSDTQGSRGIGGGRMQRPAEASPGAPEQAPSSEHRGHLLEKLRGAIQHLMQDGFDSGAGKARPQGLPSIQG